VIKVFAGNSWKEIDAINTVVQQSFKDIDSVWTIVGNSWKNIDIVIADPLLFYDHNNTKNLYLSTDSGDSGFYEASNVSSISNISNNHLTYIDKAFIITQWKQYSYSLDNGLSWTTREYLPTNITGGTAYGLMALPQVNAYIIPGYLGYWVSNSTDVATTSWTNRSWGSTVSVGPNNYFSSGITAFNKFFINTDPSQINRISSTEDGITWSYRSKQDAWLINLVYDQVQGRLYNFPYNGGTIYEYTDDGINWSSRSNYPAAGVKPASIVAGKGILLVADRSSGIWITTDGGSSWLSYARPYLNTDLHVMFNGKKFIMYTGSQYSGTKVILNSDDGITWTLVASSATNLYVFERRSF
jgi:photosystem II stability/assembly factor-like uncharacterized protein